MLALVSTGREMLYIHLCLPYALFSGRHMCFLFFLFIFLFFMFIVDTTADVSSLPLAFFAPLLPAPTPPSLWPSPHCCLSPWL